MRMLRLIPQITLLLAVSALGLSAQTAAVAPQPAITEREFPRVEVYGGIAYANLNLPGLSDRRHAGGWGTSVTANVTRHFGFTGDFAGQYKPQCAENDVDCIIRELFSTQLVRYSSYQFLGGPQVRFGGVRFSGFAHALFGGVRHRVRLLDTATGVETEIKPGPQFAMAYGGGLDWNLGEQLAVRLLQVDYIPVRESPSWKHNVRIQGGIVLRFGGRK